MSQLPIVRGRIRARQHGAGSANMIFFSAHSATTFGADPFIAFLTPYAMKVPMKLYGALARTKLTGIPAAGGAWIFTLQGLGYGKTLAALGTHKYACLRCPGTLLATELPPRGRVAFRFCDGHGPSTLSACIRKVVSPTPYPIALQAITIDNKFNPRPGSPFFNNAAYLMDARIIKPKSRLSNRIQDSF